MKIRVHPQMSYRTLDDMTKYYRTYTHIPLQRTTYMVDFGTNIEYLQKIVKKLAAQLKIFHKLISGLIFFTFSLDLNPHLFIQNAYARG